MTGRVDGPPGIKHPALINRTRWKTITKAVIYRDSGICHICHHGGAKTADHIVPVSLGGEPWSFANLKAVHHAKCNTCGRRCNLLARAPEPSGRDTSSYRAPWVPWEGPKAEPRPEEPSLVVWQL